MIGLAASWLDLGLIEKGRLYFSITDGFFSQYYVNPYEKENIMPTRNAEFKNIVMPLWEETYELIKNINVKNVSIAERDEIAYLQKLMTYLFEKISSIDLDFIPSHILTGSRIYIERIRDNIINYNNTRNVNFLYQANNTELDALIHDLMPYVFHMGEDGKALQSALSQYIETISEHSKSYFDSIQEFSLKIKEINNEMELIAKDLLEKKAKFDSYDNDLFSKSEGLQSKINLLIDDINKKNNHINNFYNDIFNDKGIKKQLDTYEKEIKKQNEDIHHLKNESSHVLDELKDYHLEILGKEDETGEKQGGLKNEILLRTKEYDELNKKIEALLPGATSVGLASAYKDMKDRCSEDIKKYGNMFYGALIILFMTVLFIHSLDFLNILKSNNHVVFSSELGSFSNIPNAKISLNNEYATPSLGSQLMALLRMFALKLPFLVPALWLAMFAAKRRNEAQRLEQEYAHKEALAKSYDSYRQQIQNLGQDEQDKLLPFLLKNMIKAIALNPAETLDKNHKDETPIDTVSKLDEVVKKEPLRTLLDLISKKENS
ncbi:MAG: hypothetical protein Q4D63_04080 [Neisseria animaloris]|nr:hypothetical protein [Neisseria animaloris]